MVAAPAHRARRLIRVPVLSTEKVPHMTEENSSVAGRATQAAPELRVGMIGYAFMGAAHSQAWRSAPHFFELPLHPRMSAVCGRDAAKVSAAATQLGWESAETSW